MLAESMQPPTEPKPFYAKTGYRLVSAVFGALLVGIGVFLLVTAYPLTAWELLGGSALMILGMNHVLTARSGTEPWLSTLGPLP